jgi:TPP-dependent pyruvate/acetoin dehydrogenase alpha subunit
MAKASTSDRATPRPSDALTPEKKLELHRYQLITRRLEERLTNLYRQNQVVGGLYRSLGQEGETIAASMAMEPQDPLGPLIRNMGALFLRGYRPRDIAMQYMARSGGPTQGKDLNVHFGGLPEPGIIPPVSMLGDVIPVAAGVALAARLRGEDRVPLTWIGDGGTSTGAFYEGMNLAAVWSLPLVVVAEANGYAYSTPMDRQMAVDRIADKGLGLGIRAVTIDGNDVLAVYDAVREARELAAAGEGPSLVEVVTYRRRGHAEHDMQKYVPQEEITEWEGNDPIDRFAEVLKSSGVADGEALDALDAEVRAYVDAEVEVALASPFPDPAVTLESVYADPPRARDHLAPYREESP